MFMTGQNINIMNSCATLTTADFFREMPGIPKATVYSRIRSMVIRGIVQRVGRGVYERTGKSAFAFEASESMRAIASSITKDFPYINYCVWDLSPINTLAQHLINFNVTIVDVDREAVEAVYQRLRDTHEKVLTTKRMFDGLADYNGFILVRRLVTDAPLMKRDGISLPTLEKFLVDIALDKEFFIFQGYEIEHIFSNAYTIYAMNRNRLLRYAGRKNHRDEIERLLINNSSIN